MTQTTDTPEFVLQELLKNDAFVFRVHNIKLTTLTINRDLPQMFLAHYDSLDDDIKADTPLSPELLRQINTLMTADEANRLLGLASGTIRAAYHIKISGTVVIVNDDLPLALHLSFTNTAKSSQAVYGQDIATLVEQEAQKWQLTGTVNLLHKSSKHKLISIDMDDEMLTIEPHDGYVRLPNAHALATTHAINTIKNNTPELVRFVHDAIVDKVMATYQEQTQ